MNKYPLEPGLLSTFRTYTVVRLLFVVIATVFYYLWGEPVLEFWCLLFLSPFLADVLFLTIYLSWPWFQRRLGRFYLPVGLLIAAVGPIVQVSYVFPLYSKDSLLAFLLVFLILLVPLILTAWQYSFRYVVLFGLATSLFEFFTINTASQPDKTQLVWSVILLLGRFVLSIFIGYIVSNLVAEQRNQRHELAEANRKLVRYASTLEQLAVTQERNRLARELHDTLAHTLSAIAVQLDAIAAVCEPMPPKASIMLERALSTARAGLDETRRAVHDLRAAPLEDLGLALAIRTLAANTAARSALELTLNAPDQISNLSPEVEQCYYRVAQEALENVARHANARWVGVSLEQVGGHLTLTISDDGQGFAPESSDLDERLGIKGMRERANLIGGTLEVESGPDRGTTVRLRTGGVA